MTTTGKIDRLSRGIREQLNIRLRERAGDAEVAEWLRKLPEANAESKPFSKADVCAWRATGYRDWLMRQEAGESVAEMVAEADELKARLGDSVTDKLAGWLIPQYAAAARGELASLQGRKRWQLLRSLCGELVALRRGDQLAERLRIKREYLDLMKAGLKERKQAEFEKWLKRPEVLEKVTPKVTRDRVMKRMFQVMDHVMLGHPIEDFKYMDDEENLDPPAGGQPSRVPECETSPSPQEETE
jgi:hypothetical protein